jgi:hypothetical protein
LRTEQSLCPIKMPIFCASIRLVYRNPNRLYGNSSIGAEESVKIFHLSKMFAGSKKKIKTSNSTQISLKKLAGKIL